MSGDTVELDLYFVAETAMAYGVTDEEPDDPVIWLPKSQVEMLSDTRLGGVAKFDVPEWLAEAKGLV